MGDGPAARPPAHLEELLRRCVHKDPKNRLRDVGDARLSLEDPRDAVVPIDTRSAGSRTPPIGLPTLAAFITGGLLVGAAAWIAPSSEPEPPDVTRLQITPPAEAAITLTGYSRDVAITPDGSRVIYIGDPGTGAPRVE